MITVEIEKTSEEGAKTLGQLRHEEFDSPMVAFDSDMDEQFLVLPSCEDDKQNIIIYIGESSFEALADSWNDNDKFFIKEVQELNLRVKA